MGVELPGLGSSLPSLPAFPVACTGSRNQGFFDNATLYGSEAGAARLASGSVRLAFAGLPPRLPRFFPPSSSPGFSRITSSTWLSAARPVDSRMRE